VIIPLAARLSCFRSHTLDRCGHYPWKERHAVGRFYEILWRELYSS